MNTIPYFLPKWVQHTFLVIISKNAFISIQSISFTHITGRCLPPLFKIPNALGHLIEYFYRTLNFLKNTIRAIYKVLKKTSSLSISPENQFSRNKHLFAKLVKGACYRSLWLYGENKTFLVSFAVFYTQILIYGHI